MRLLLAIALVTLGACSTAPASPDGEPTRSLVDVLFATDRVQTTSKDPAQAFGTERGTLSYGVSRVAISIDKRRSRFADPMLWPRESGNDDEQRAVVRRVSTVDRAAFLEQLSRRIARSPDEGALVYVKTGHLPG